MATVKVNITGDASSLKQATGQAQTALGGLDKATASVKSGMASAGIAIAGTAAALAVAKRAYDQTVGAVIDYNKSILDASRATRMGVEDLSRFVQVGDDMGVSMDSITRALQMATKNGFAPSIDAIAALSDQTNAMASPTEKAAYLAKMFGRNWAELNPILELGGQRIKELAAAQQSGLVATEREIAETEKYRLAVDQLNDSKQALLNTIGMTVVSGINREVEAWGLAKQALDEGRIGVMGFMYTYGELVDGLREGAVREELFAIRDAADGISGAGVAALDAALDALPSALSAAEQAFQDQTATTVEGYLKNLEYKAGVDDIASAIAALRDKQVVINVTTVTEEVTKQTWDWRQQLATPGGRGRTEMAIGGLATPGLHMVGEEGPELIRTDNRGNINVLRASVTRMLSKGVGAMAHALDQGGGGGGSLPIGWVPTGFNPHPSTTDPWHSDAWYGGNNPNKSAPAAETKATAAQAVAEAAASAIPQAVAQGTRLQTEAAQRIASDNAKANAANARTLAQIRDILLMQGGAKDIGREVGKANQLLDARF